MGSTIHHWRATQYLLVIAVLTSVLAAQQSSSPVVRQDESTKRAEAMMQLGLAYERGQGRPRDYVRARAAYVKAADLGNAEAMNHLGNLFRNGKGTDKDPQRARYWYAKSARLGNSFAMDKLGELYLHGEGVARDLTLAQQWFEKSATLGNAAAMSDLGYMFVVVRGVERNYKEGRRWLERGIATRPSRRQRDGRASAMANLAAMYFEGIGVERDYVRARRLLERATALGSTDAMVILGYLYQCAAGVPRDMQKAMRLYEKAAALGDASAMTHLGLNYSGVIGIEIDYQKTQDWYEKASALGEVTAMYNLGYLYDEGPPALRDYGKAIEWYEKAAAHADDETANNFGAPSATYRLGYLYEHGQGVAKDEHRAREWYQRSAELDNGWAMQTLSKMYADGRGGEKDDRLALLWRTKADDWIALHFPKPPPPKFPACASGNLDVTFQSTESQDHQFVLAVNLHNTSTQTCTLDAVAPAPDLIAGDPQAKVKSCYTCGDAKLRTGKQLTLPPQAWAHQTYAWNTESADPESPCLAPGWLWTSVNSDPHRILLTSKAFVKPICSAVVTSSYKAGRFPTAKGPEPNTHLLPSIQWVIDKTTFLQQEEVPLRLVIFDPGMALSLDDKNCPVLLRRVRESDGFARTDDVWGKKCRVETASGSGRRIAVTLDAGHLSQWGGQARNYILDVGTLVKQRELWTVAMSPSLALTIADPAALARQWGPEIKGISVALTLDKATYELGQDIPLHIARQNVSSTEPILGPNPVWDPDFTVDVQVRDSCGLRIKGTGGGIWMGHGAPYIAYLPGKPAFIERSLYQMASLPDTPGTYSVVAFWHPCTGKVVDEYPGSRDLRPYVIAESAPSIFRVVDPEHPDRPNPEPLCVARPPGFELVDTSLGPKTALQDNLTGLRWLHLRATANLGYQAISKALAEGGKFEGWRFATPEELHQFFADYVGSPDGVSTDAALAARFVEDIDGTSGILDIPETTGHVMYGEIIVANPVTGNAEINPNRYGWASEGSTTPAWLVRKVMQ